MMNLQPEDLQRDRVPENPMDILDVTIPDLTSPNRYEDLWEVDVAENVEKVKPNTRNYRANLKRWYLRLN